MQDAVAVSLEAGAPCVGLLGSGAPATAGGPGGPRREDHVLGTLAFEASERLDPVVGAQAGGRVGVGGAQAVAPVSRHRGRPAAAPLGRCDGGRLHGP